MLNSYFVIRSICGLLNQNYYPFAEATMYDTGSEAAAANTALAKPSSKGLITMEELQSQLAIASVEKGIDADSEISQDGLDSLEVEDADDDTHMIDVDMKFECDEDDQPLRARSARGRGRGSNSSSSTLSQRAGQAAAAVIVATSASAMPPKDQTATDPHKAAKAAAAPPSSTRKGSVISGNVVIKATAALANFEATYSDLQLWENKIRKRTFQAAVLNLNESSGRVAATSPSTVEADSLATRMVSSIEHKEALFAIFQDIRNAPEKFTEVATADQVELMLGLDISLINNIVLFLAAELLKGVDSQDSCGQRFVN
jgi:hypothetical protein